MMEVKFVVPGIPTAKGRPRFIRATGRTYTPAATARAEDTFGQVARQAMGDRPLFAGPAEVSITFTFPWPVSTPKKRRADPRGALKDTKPDLDNLVKLVKDALGGICWRSDGCVAVLHARKLFGERAETIIRIRDAGGDLLSEAPRVAAPVAKQEALL